MHSHLIPGIDDGAKTMEDSIGMIEKLIGLGYEKIITTPHIFNDYYPNTPEIILSGLKDLKAALAERGMKIEIEAAAEYYVDGFFENLLQTNAQLLTFSDNCLLIEFSTFAEPANALDIIFQLNTRGYQVILAHPERYLYFTKQFEKFEKFKSVGCSLQVNLLSLTGYYGSEQKKLALKLLKAGMVDYLGTDLHKESQIAELMKMDKKILNKILKKGTFKNSNL